MRAASTASTLSGTDQTRSTPACRRRTLAGPCREPVPTTPPPTLRRTRFTTTRTSAPGTTSRRSRSPRTSRCRPIGSAVPSAITVSACSSETIVAALRRGAATSNAISSCCSSEKPQSTTVIAASDRASVQTWAEPGRAELRPAIGAWQPGQHPQQWPDLTGVPGQARDVERALVRRSGRGGEPGCLVEQTERLRDRRGVRVGIGEHASTCRPPRARRPGSPRSSCVRNRPDPTPRRPGRARSAAVGDASGSARDGPGASRGLRRAARLSATAAVTRGHDVGDRRGREQHGLDADRGEPARRPLRPPPDRTARRRRRPRAAAARRCPGRGGASESATSAARATPAPAVASRSARSTHRRTTLISGRSASRPSRSGSQAAPPVASTVGTGPGVVTASRSTAPPGTRTSWMLPLLTASTTAGTSSASTSSTTPIVEPAAPNPPSSPLTSDTAAPPSTSTGSTLARDHARRGRRDDVDIDPVTSGQAARVVVLRDRHRHEPAVLRRRRRRRALLPGRARRPRRRGRAT